MNSHPTILFIRTDAAVFDPRIQKEAGSLARAGYSVQVFGWDRKKDFPQSEILNNVLYFRSAIRGVYGSKLLVFILPLFWAHAISYSIKTRPSVIHACDLDALIPALITRWFTGCKVIYDIFDNFADKITGLPDFVRKIIRGLDKLLMRCADHVIVTDENRKRILPADLAKPVSVILNVPPKQITPISSISNGVFQICYAGVIHEHRGLRIIANALHGIEGVECTFAGWIPRGSDADFLKTQSQIKFVGKLPYLESLRLMAESNAILALYDPSLPINALASSNKVFEAMSVSRPVITNRETTMAPIVMEEECGILIPYGDQVALRNAILSLRDDQELSLRLGYNGARAFSSKYNWEQMEKRLLQIYSEYIPSGIAESVSESS